MAKADINRFFQNFQEKTFQVMTNNGEFKNSPLSRFFNIENIHTIKERITNPFILSACAVGVSLSSLYFSLNKENTVEVQNNSQVQNYLSLTEAEQFYDNQLEMFFNGKAISLYFNEHKLEIELDGNIPKYLLLDESDYNERLLSNLDWDYKTPAKPFEKYFSDDYKNKIPTQEELNEIEDFYGLPHNLLFSMAHKESRLSLYKTSSKEAKGFLGFQEATARDFGLVTDNNDQIFNAYASADTAARYILWLNGYVNGMNADIFDLNKDDNGYSNLDYALAAYNAGPHKIKRGNKKRIPNYKETLGYIKDINLLLSGEGYIVQKGDSIYNIADNHNISLNNLFRNNLDIESNKDLKAGEILIISNNSEKELSLIVERGFSMYKISKKTGVDLNQLLTYNELTENSIIRIGQEIKIPPLIEETNTVNKKYSRKI